MKLVNKLLAALLFMFCIIFLSIPSQSQETPKDADQRQEGIDTLFNNQISLIKGELVLLKVDKLTRISLTDPLVADIIDAKENEVLIIGQQVGQTVLFIWDDHGKRSVTINVSNRDPQLVKDRIKELLQEAGIIDLNLEISELESKVVVSGQLPEKKRDQLDEILLPFEEDIIELISDEEIEDLVQVDMQITELNTTLTKSLGIEWITGGSGGSGSGTGGGGFLPTYTETIPQFDGSPSDFFKIGEFRRTAVLQANIHALLEQGKGRVLSQPKLVVSSGKEANFLVGGEIPIRTTTTSEGAVQENVSFKQFGITMNITPTILKKNKIEVVMGIEVSDVDSANAVGPNVAFTTRSADTHLILDDGQTIIMAGLIKQRESELVKKVPFLGEVPILGLIFRSKTMPVPKEDTELVIMMTPHILRSSPTDETVEGEGGIIDRDGTIAKYTSKAQPFYSGIPSEMRDYVRSVQNKISQSLRYPPEAIQYGWQGTVKVNMLILHDGTLAFALVRESSGYDMIDDNALQMAKINAPYSSFPPETGLQELNVTIPIVYSLNRQ